MNVKISAALTLLLVAAMAVPAHGGEKEKKKGQGARAMLEKMDAVPCGAKQKGLSGLGTFWASVGITHVNTDEKLCPQYLLRTDEMDYRIRPMDLKHPAVLPIGQEVVFKIKGDRMLLKVPEGDQKMRAYEVVSMTPAETTSSGSASSRGSVQ